MTALLAAGEANPTDRQLAVMTAVLVAVVAVVAVVEWARARRREARRG
jgi:uncharacterized membrane protein